MIDKSQVGHVGGVVQLLDCAVFHVDVIDNRWRGCDQIDVILALDPVADHLEVQQAEETTAEAETKSGRCFHLEAEGRVVQRQLFDAVAQVFEFGGVHGEQTTEHHGLRRFKARQRALGAFFLVRDRIADPRVAHLFDRRGQKTDFTGVEAVDFGHGGAENADAVNVVHRPVLHHADTVALFQLTIHDPHQNDDTQIAVVP